MPNDGIQRKVSICKEREMKFDPKLKYDNVILLLFWFCVHLSHSHVPPFL